MTTTHIHHADPANARAGRVAAALMKMERQCVKARLERRLIDSERQRRDFKEHATAND